MTAYSFKKQFVAPIRVGLGIQVNHEPGDAHVYHPKRQTIRAIGKKRHARPGETVQLYCGLRTQHCFKIADAKCSSADSIRMQIASDRPWIWMKIGNDVSGPITENFARADGFASVEEMWKFWRKEHPDTPDFRGVLIRWEPLQVQR